MLLGMISDVNLRKAMLLLDNRTLLQSNFGYDKSIIIGDNQIIDNKTLL